MRVCAADAKSPGTDSRIWPATKIVSFTRIPTRADSNALLCVLMRSRAACSRDLRLDLRPCRLGRTAVSLILFDGDDDGGSAHSQGLI